ncbi:MAG: cation diffusion facilitator family transporter [Myxococcales bacterium]|nr:cation diffusion facilitator family transporter [Myxococcales bacterium]
MGSEQKHGTGHILQSLVVNAVIATGKGVAAVLTGSGAMLAETLHSAADCGNQGLLLLGVHRARRPADERHPLGYGRALYFWSFMVALLLFSGGGVFSVYEGIHKIRHPEPVDRVWIALVILLCSLALEGAATLSNIKEIGRRRGDVPFMRYLRETKDSDLVVVFGENMAATLGLALATVAVIVSHYTGDTRWDGVGSVAIGVVLIGVAVFLAVEIKSLLIGEAADPKISRAVADVVTELSRTEELLWMTTIQQGPGEVMVAVKLRFAATLTTRELAQAIDEFEAELRKRCPEVRWLFVEPALEP